MCAIFSIHSFIHRSQFFFTSNLNDNNKRLMVVALESMAKESEGASARDPRCEMLHMRSFAAEI